MRHRIVAALAAGTIGLAGFGVAFANPAPNFVLGTTGNDLLIGSNQPDVIIAFTGHDVLTGGKGADRLYGRPGNDRLIGWGAHSGADLLAGGFGFDICVGDSSDTFRSCEVVVVR